MEICSFIVFNSSDSKCYKLEPERILIWNLLYVYNCRIKRGRVFGPDHVDIFTFYNEVFVPSVSPLMLELGPMKVDHVGEANNKPENSKEE
ncbi:hypothetical protein YC2023_124256 [Brassica napus]